MDFILSYLLSSAVEPQEQQEPQEPGTQFTDLPPEILERIAEYQESEIATGGSAVRRLGVSLMNMRPGMGYYDALMEMGGRRAVEDETARITQQYDTWRDTLGRAILVNNWIRRLGGMARMNPAQMLLLQRRYL